MKKLLSLLSVLTISGTAVPTTIAASPYQKEETIKNSDINSQNNLKNLNRNKRGANHGDEIEASWDDIFASFKPDLWEEIKINYDYYSNLTDFQEWFKNRMNAGVWQDYRIGNSDLKGLAKNIWNNWSHYNNIWENSNKRQRIRIKCAWDRNFSYRYVNIRNDDRNLYPNWRLDELNNNWNRDFNNKTNLGIINNDKNETIWNAIKEQNPNLDISQFNIINKTNFSFLNKEFSVEIIVKENNKKYPKRNIKFSFISKDFLINELPNILGQENLIKNWNSNFNEWKVEVNRQKMQDLPKYGNDERGQALKRTWKGNHLIELKNKLLSLNHILETIDNKFKINELYKTVQGLQKDINYLKQQISKLNQKIDNIKINLDNIKINLDNIKINLEGNKDLETCTKTGALISATTSWIPVVGTLISTISGTVSAICDIANT